MENNQQQYREKKYKTQLPAEFGMAKIPPQAPELEEAVLGALMLEKDALSEVVDILKPDMFYKEAHQNIFKSIQSLFEKSQPVDILTVTEELRLKGELEMVGGAYFVTQLTNKVASAANIEFHARIIAQKYIQRELIRLSGEIIKDAYEDTTDVFDLLDKSEQALFSITEGNLRRSYAGMSELIKKSVEQIESLKDKKDGLTGVPTGFSEFDRETSGWQKSDLVIVAARPGMGKTAFVISMARNAAVDFGQAVAIFSLEMSAVQLVNRLISAEAELPSEKLKKGNLEDHEWEQLHHKIGKLSDAPLFIDDTPALSIFELRAKCRRLKSQHDIQLIIIDYLQLMNGSTDNKQGNREQEIGNISRAMKSLAKELEVPVVALSQLNRSVETRGGDKKPMLSDLRESGSIEQDADMVLFIYRPEYYDIMEDENGVSTKDVAEVIIAKHRNGSLKTIPLKFIGKYIKFTDLDPSYEGMGGALLSGNEMLTPENQSFITRKSKMDDEDDVPF
jgi:replicative DNA helicase